MNKIIIIGRMTKDAEERRTSGGVAFVQFGLAVQRSYADASGEKQADFINCIAWRGLAENIAKYVRKGDRLAIVGELQTRSYTDKDGNKRINTEILVQEAEFLGNKQAAEDKPGESAYKPQKECVNDFKSADEDLPF